jgi:hypothetical protein
MREVFEGAPADVLAQQDERATLILSVPELRMRILDEFAGSMLLFADVVARRVGRQLVEFVDRTVTPTNNISESE